jgi:5-methylcytosine-specific restriction endonuclease McrBC regulatory subunit McrC
LSEKQLINCIENETLTLCEWDSLSFPLEHFDLISKPITCTKQISVNRWFNSSYLSASQHVGIWSSNEPVELPDNLRFNQIIVLPKIVKRNTNGSYNWANFLAMMEIAYEVKLPDFDTHPELEQCLNPAALFAAIYVISVESLLRKIRRSYTVRSEKLHSRIKGKLLVGAYVRESLSHCEPQNPVCQFYELTGDNLLNRIIKSGLRVAKSLLHNFAGGEWTGRVNKCLAEFYAVADVRITPVDFACVHLHAQNRHYRQPLDWAKLLIQHSRPDLAGGPIGTKGFFFDMDNLFERFVAGIFKQSGFPIYYQTAGHTKSISIAEQNHTLKPDVLIQKDDLTLVIDAKYKKAFEASYSGDEDVYSSQFDYSDSTSVVKIYLSDIYQMNTYLDVYGSDMNTIGIIVYPGKDSDPIFVENLQGKQIWLLPVDLFRDDFHDLDLSARLDMIIAGGTT